MKGKQILRATFIALHALVAHGQNETIDPPQNREIVVILVNACDTDYPERWLASLDMHSSDQIRVSDIRIGDSTPIHRMKLTVNDKITITAHDSDTVLCEINSHQLPDNQNVVIITGNLGFKPSLNFIALPFDAFDAKKNLEHDRGANVIFCNAVSSIPIFMETDPQQPKRLEFEKFDPYVVQTGNFSYRIVFPFMGKKRVYASELLVSPSDRYLLLVCPSYERKGLPVLKRINITQALYEERAGE